MQKKIEEVCIVDSCDILETNCDNLLFSYVHKVDEGSMRDDYDCLTFLMMRV
jgi:hypothetical protein